MAKLRIGNIIEALTRPVTDQEKVGHAATEPKPARVLTYKGSDYATAVGYG